MKKKKVANCFCSRNGVQKLNYLYRDDSIAPVLGQVNLRNKAMVSRNIGHKHKRESTKSIGEYAGTEQEEDDLLETSPLTQERCGVVIILHGPRIWTVSSTVFSCSFHFKRRNRPACLQPTRPLATPCNIENMQVKAQIKSKGYSQP